MTQPVVPPDVAIGACLYCRSLFLVTPGTPTCLLCGRPPAFTLPFLTPQPEPVEGPLLPIEELPPAGAPTLIGVVCPYCNHNITLSISDKELSVVPPPPPTPAEEDLRLYPPYDPAHPELLSSETFNPDAGAAPSPDSPPSQEEEDRTNQRTP